MPLLLYYIYRVNGYIYRLVILYHDSFFVKLLKYYYKVGNRPNIIMVVN